MNGIKLFIAVLPLLSILLTGCEKDEGACVSSTGKVIIQERPAQYFQTVEVYDNINLILTQDIAASRIMVEAGKNLMEGIITEIDSGRLVIRNNNRCNWLRSFEIPINVYLTFPDLDTIIFRAAGNITCSNAWTNESVCLDVIEGAGNIDLKLQVYRSFILVRYGTTSINLEGFSQVSTLISHGFGPLHAENLISKFTYVSTRSPNDLFVYSSVEMAVEIGNIGNVYYRGDPAVITTNIYGEGKLIEF
jgi:hypothetical protein